MRRIGTSRERPCSPAEAHPVPPDGGPTLSSELARVQSERSKWGGEPHRPTGHPEVSEQGEPDHRGGGNAGGSPPFSRAMLAHPTPA
jgi:hypothetical protein